MGYLALGRMFAALLVFAAIFSGCDFFGGRGTAPNVDDTQPPEQSVYDPEYPVEVAGVEISFRPARVISLAPSLTEKIYDLGHGGRLVGISEHQGDFPPSLVHVPSYGMAMLPDIEGILSREPHLVFAVSELPVWAMNALDAANIPLVVLPSYAHNMDELAEIYRALAHALSGRTSGELIWQRLMETIDGRIDEIAAESMANGLYAVYLRSPDFTVATGDTLEGQLIERLGFVNIAASQTDWSLGSEFAASPEGAALIAGVDVIFLDENYVSAESLSQSSIWQGHNALIVNIDSSVFERQTLRLLGQLEVMAMAV